MAIWRTECFLDNTYCFPTAKMVAGTRLNVSLYVLYTACQVHCFADVVVITGVRLVTIFARVLKLIGSYDTY